MKKSATHILVFIFCSVFIANGFAQCPKFYDSNASLSSNPYWVSCNSKDFKLNLKSNVNFGSYSIDWGDGTAIQNGTNYVALSNISHTYTLTVDTFIVLITLPTCTVNGVVVMEKPVSAGIKIPPSAEIISCSPKLLQFINASSNVSKTTHFIWKFGDGTTSGVYDYLNAGQTIDHLYDAKKVNCETAVTLSAYNYCTQGLLTSVNYSPIRIYDKDDVKISTSYNSRCWPDNTFDFKNETERNCLKIGNVTQRLEKWNFGDYWGLGRDSIIDWKDWPPTSPIAVSYPTFGTYTVMLMDSSLCGVASKTISVSIINKPTSLITVLTNTICQGVPITFTNNSTPNKNYLWNFGTGLGFQPLPFSNPEKTYFQDGIFSVKLVTYIAGYNSYCSDTNKLSLEVKPKPNSDFTFSPLFGCDNSKVTFTDASTGLINQWDWNFGNTFSSINKIPLEQSYTSAGDYTVSLMTSTTNGCKDTVYKVYRVYQSPIANFSVSTICSKYQTPFFDLSKDFGAEKIVTYQLNFGDGSPTVSGLANFNHKYLQAGNFMATLQVYTEHCSSTKTLSLFVNQTPSSNFSANSFTICPSSSIDLTNTTLDANQYFWNLGNGETSTSTDVSPVYQNTTNLVLTYTTKLVANTLIGCKDSVSKLITVNPKPIVGFTTDYQPSCAPVKISFENKTKPLTNTYVWDFGDGETLKSKDALHLFANQTKELFSPFVKLKGTNSYNCSDSSLLKVVIYPEAIFNFTPSFNFGCSPLNAILKADSGAVSYLWSFGNGSYADGSYIQPFDFVNSKSKIDTFLVKLFSKNGYDCKDTSISKVVVKPSPKSSFGQNVNEGCAILPVKFINSSVGAIKYDWFFGDGVTSSLLIPSHTYTNDGLLSVDYPVSLVVTSANDCKDSTSAKIVVYPRANYTFTLSQDTVCSTVSTKFEPTPGATSYLWNYGDGKIQTAFNPIYSYSTDIPSGKSFTISMTATSPYNCKNTYSTSIFVYPKPSSSYTVSKTTGCAPLITRFNNKSKDAISFKWYFGDDSVSTEISPEHTYNNLGLLPQDFELSLVSLNDKGCKDSVSSLINVLPEANYNFVNLPDSGCTDLSLNFFAQPGAKSYLWNFGDNLSSFDVNPNHLFVNKTTELKDYQVRLYTSNNYGCKDSVKKVIRVFPSPRASFFVSPITQRYPEATVSFNNSSTTDVSYKWNLGDETLLTDYILAPHTYTTWGVYSASLTVDNGYCKDSTSQKITILPPFPVSNFLGGAKGCSPLTVTFTNTSIYATSYNWDLGDGNTISDVNPTHIYNTPGVYNVMLKSVGPGGNDVLTKTGIVTVYQSPNAFYSATPLLVYVPNESVYFTNQSQNAISYLWDFGDGKSSTEPSPRYKYYDVGEYDVVLVATGKNNCTDTFKLATKIRAEAITGIEVPNAFTPSLSNSDNDGKFDPTALNNDIFHPNLQGIVDYELTIYNKWGELLFKTINQEYGWNGFYKGKLCAEDTYIYKIYAFTKDSKVIQKSGDLLLLR